MAGAIGKAAGKKVLEVVGKEVGDAVEKELGNVIETMIGNVTGSVSNPTNNTFGTPITDSTAKKLLPEHQGNITNLQKARLALAVKDNEKRFNVASNHVKKLKEQSGNGVSTLCLIYNATGASLSLVTNYDWFGHIGQDPYPTHIGNGQWAAFLHEKTAIVPSGSVAGVVYRGKNASGNEYDLMISWHNPWQKVNQNNTVRCEISDVGHYDNNSIWGAMQTKLEGGRSTSSAKNKGCKATVTIGNGTSPTLKAVVTLDGA